MFLKRKRSDSEISSTSYSTSPSPTQSGNIASAPYSSQFMHEITPLHLSSRTRKRVRDNRPSENQIHVNTLNILFSAQRQPQTAPLYSQPPTMPVSAPAQQQSSLHSFWALPARPTSRDSNNNSAPSLLTPTYLQETHCEDCDTILINRDGDAMEMDVDVDVCGGSSDFACSQCRKQVCHHCAVSNLGQQRQCLTCAGRREWVGGPGWVSV